MIPGVAGCLSLMEEEGMLANIKAHCLVVAGVAEGLRRQLSRIGVMIPADLVVAGGLLHDIAKTQCLEERCNHARIGAEICREHGFDAVAEIVAEHVRLPRVPAAPTASTLVYYADKRVNHDRVVSLEERKLYIIGKYSNGEAARAVAIRARLEIWHRVEEIIFAGLDLDPVAIDQAFAVDVTAIPDLPSGDKALAVAGGE